MRLRNGRPTVVIAWKVRHALGLDALPMGPSASHNDNIFLDYKDNDSPSGFGHPDCKGGNDSANIIENLSKEFPSGPRHQ